MTDLVTGATGFIGSHLAERLARSGRRVRVLVRPESRGKLRPGLAEDVALGDLRDRASLAAAVRGVERVFHCAGHVLDWGTDRVFDEANVRGTRWLLEAALEAGVGRVVHMSSIAVFGTPSPARFDDDTPLASSREPYTRTKVEGERVAMDVAARGLPVVVLRPAVVYGPRGTWLEQPLAMIEQGKMFLLGGGHGTCHPCYIENLLDATLLAAENHAAIGRAFIVGDDDPISFRTYFDAIAKIAGKAPIRRSIPKPAAHLIASGMELWARATGSDERPLLTHAAIAMVTTRSEMSMRRIREELGFAPRFRFVEAMDAILQLRRL